MCNKRQPQKGGKALVILGEKLSGVLFWQNKLLSCVSSAECYDLRRLKLLDFIPDNYLRPHPQTDCAFSVTVVNMILVTVCFEQNHTVKPPEQFGFPTVVISNRPLALRACGKDIL